MTYHNRWLWPATEKPIKHTVHPMNLGTTVSEVRHIAVALGMAIANRGYATPRWETLEKICRVKFGDQRITCTFPPPTPGIGDFVTVLDADYNARTLQVVETNKDTLTADLYLDLDLGEWITFTTQRLQPEFGHTHLHMSRAATFPAPVPE